MISSFSTVSGRTGGKETEGRDGEGEPTLSDREGHTLEAFSAAHPGWKGVEALTHGHVRHLARVRRVEAPGHILERR